MEFDDSSTHRFVMNSTESWTTTFVKVDGSDDICEITSTPGHKYYLPFNNENRNPNEKQEHDSYEELSVKWVSACNLKKGDKVLLSNGKYGIIIKVETKLLDGPETTYNFEVEISLPLLTHSRKDKITGKKEDSYEVEGKGLVKAEDIVIGDKIILEGGEIAEVLSLEVKTVGGPMDTYNLEIADFHTYYVGESGVLVHNCCSAADDIASVNPEKFSEYIFNPEYAGNGKAAVFEGLGYSKGDAKLLAQIYRTQGGSNYLSGNYTLGKLDSFGQRLTIPIELNGVGSAAGKVSILNSGWIVEGSKIRLVTPFAGFA